MDALRWENTIGEEGRPGRSSAAAAARGHVESRWGSRPAAVRLNLRRFAYRLRFALMRRLLEHELGRSLPAGMDGSDEQLE
ncbi:MAG: hypothetical protein ACRDHL_03880 [Candidatus Promineifilaceae bacterium]